MKGKVHSIGAGKVSDGKAEIVPTYNSEIRVIINAGLAEHASVYDMIMNAAKSSAKVGADLVVNHFE